MAFNIEQVNKVVKELSTEGIVFTVTFSESPSITIHYRSNYDHAEAEIFEGGENGNPHCTVRVNNHAIIDREYDPDKVSLKDLLYTIATAAGDMDQAIEDMNEDMARLIGEEN